MDTKLPSVTPNPAYTFRKGECHGWRTALYGSCGTGFDLPRWRYPEAPFLDSSVTLRTGHVFSRTSSRLLGAGFDASTRWFPQQRDDLYSVGARLRAGAFTGRSRWTNSTLPPWSAITTCGSAGTWARRRQKGRCADGHEVRAYADGDYTPLSTHALSPPRCRAVE